MPVNATFEYHEVDYGHTAVFTLRVPRPKLRFARKLRGIAQLKNPTLKLAYRKNWACIVEPILLQDFWRKLGAA